MFNLIKPIIPCISCYHGRRKEESPPFLFDKFLTISEKEGYK